MRKYFIHPDTPRFKGQLHFHTKNSDGAYTPDEALRAYKEKGYDFVAFTEHNRPTCGGMRDGVLVLSGIELNQNIIEDGYRAAHHIIGIDFDTEKFILPPAGSQTQALIDAIKKAGGIAIYAHPAWSMVTAEEIKPFKGIDIIEVMNGVSEIFHDRGDSSQQIDKLMSEGYVYGLAASDDTHYYKGEFASTATIALCGSLEKVPEALRSGDTYCTTMGPAIKSLYAEDGKLFAECEKAERILFMSDIFYSTPERFHVSEGTPLTSASYTPCQNDSYVRVVAIDKNGKKSWSNYIAVKDITSTK
ncbi:MAG: hypothetical protein IJO52_01120 [Clostridia bacterium]|nr:hypothetical protein [Clostridia bacterium]